MEHGIEYWQQISSFERDFFGLILLDLHFVIGISDGAVVGGVAGKI